MNKVSNQPEIKRLALDLHEALQMIPLQTNYFDKLNLYSEILIKDYNWKRIEVYSTHEELDALPVGTRVSTSANALAFKHETGWVILTTEGYTFSYNASSQLALPAFSIPTNASEAEPNVSLDDSSQNGTQIT